jgi:hypothetical protein
MSFTEFCQICTTMHEDGDCLQLCQGLSDYTDVTLNNAPCLKTTTCEFGTDRALRVDFFCYSNLPDVPIRFTLPTYTPQGLAAYVTEFYATIANIASTMSISNFIDIIHGQLIRSQQKGSQGWKIFQVSYVITTTKLLKHILSIRSWKKARCTSFVVQQHLRAQDSFSCVTDKQGRPPLLLLTPA